MFKISSIPYVALTDLSDSGGFKIFKWSSANNCFGDGGSGCGVAYQMVGSSLSPREVKTFTQGTGTYILLASANGNNNVYKWVTSATAPCNTATGGGFGSASTCGAPYQSLSSGVQGLSWSNYSFNVSNQYFALTNGNNSGSSVVYKWTPTGTGCPSGGGLGDGTTCGVVYQTLSKKVSNNYQVDAQDLDSVMTSNGTDVYLATTNPAFWELHVRRWVSGGLDCPTGGGFGDGTKCDTPSSPALFQIISARDGRALESAPGGTSHYLTVSDYSGIVDLYGLASASASPVCSLNATDSTGTRQLALANNGSYPSGPLTENTTYTLNCEGVGEVQLNVVVTEPTATIVANPTTLGEAAGSTNVFTVSLDIASTSDVDVNYTLAGSDATGGTDYTPVLSGTVTVPANQTSAPIAIDPINDGVGEPAEDLVVTLTPSGNYNLGTPSSATLTIEDASGGALPTLTTCIGNTTASAANGCSLGANPARVRKNTNSMISWYIPTLPVGVDCQLTATPSISGFSQSWSGTGVDVVGSQSVAIPRITIFTLTCTGPGGTESTPKTVSIIPTYQEI
jgi:hypothetical protein